MDTETLLANYNRLMEERMKDPYYQLIFEINDGMIAAQANDDLQATNHIEAIDCKIQNDKGVYGHKTSAVN